MECDKCNSKKPHEHLKVFPCAKGNCRYRTPTEETLCRRCEKGKLANEKFLLKYEKDNKNTEWLRRFGSVLVLEHDKKYLVKFPKSLGDSDLRGWRKDLERLAKEKGFTCEKYKEREDRYAWTGTERCRFCDRNLRFECKCDASPGSDCECDPPNLDDECCLRSSDQLSDCDFGEPGFSYKDNNKCVPTTYYDQVTLTKLSRKEKHL